MKTTLTLLAILLTLSSCYKSKCHNCTTTVYVNGKVSPGSSYNRKKCDMTKAQLREYQNSATYGNGTTKTVTKCEGL